jgi:hypothetical protein
MRDGFVWQVTKITRCSGPIALQVQIRAWRISGSTGDSPQQKYSHGRMISFEASAPRIASLAVVINDERLFDILARTNSREKVQADATLTPSDFRPLRDDARGETVKNGDFSDSDEDAMDAVVVQMLAIVVNATGCPKLVNAS